MTRVRRGMAIDEVRQIWLSRAEAKTKAIWDKYNAVRENAGGDFGHEGLGVYGDYKYRAAREKVRLAADLLQKAGLEVSFATIRKVTGQSHATIASYWLPPNQNLPETQASGDGDEAAQVIIQFPRSARRDITG